jgi:hypothetical protein
VAVGVEAPAGNSVGRRLEDDLAALDFNDRVDLQNLLGPDVDKDSIRQVKDALDTLKRSASGKTVLMKQMLELDDRLGLTPKSMAGLRWTVVEPPAPEADHSDVAQIDDYRARLA